MAEETENKPKFILNKQKNDSAPAQSSSEPEKKKVVVVRKKAPQSGSKPSEKGDGSKVTVKKVETQTVKAASSKTASPAEEKTENNQAKEDKE